MTTQTAKAFVNTFLNRLIRAHSEHYLDDIEDVTPLDLTRVLPQYVDRGESAYDNSSST